MQLECPVCMHSLFGPAQSDCTVPNCTADKLCDQCSQGCSKAVKEVQRKGRKSSSTFGKNTSLSGTSVTPCGHLFHTMCLKKWFSESGTKPSCPNCRFPFAVSRVVQVYLDSSVAANGSFSEPVPGTSSKASGGHVSPTDVSKTVTPLDPEDIAPAEYLGNDLKDLKMIHTTLISDFNDLKAKYLELKDEDQLHKAQIMSYECEIQSLKERMQARRLSPIPESGLPIPMSLGRRAGTIQGVQARNVNKRFRPSDPPVSSPPE